MTHKIIILHESEDIQIYRCKCCNHYNVNYKNLFMTFTRRELRAFLKILKSLTIQHYTARHPQGLKAVISNSKFDGHGMGFTQEETQYIISEIEQAMLMDQINKTLIS